MPDFAATMTGLQAAADNPELPNDVRQLAFDARELLDIFQKANAGFGAMFEEMEIGVTETVARVDENARLEERARMARELASGETRVLGLSQAEAASRTLTAGDERQENDG